MLMDRISLLLVIIGALNWGSIGLFRFDIVAWIFGSQAALGSRDCLHAGGTGRTVVHFAAFPFAGRAEYDVKAVEEDAF